MNIITFVIAVLGFVMSAATWVKDAFTQRVRLCVRVLDIHSNPDISSMFCYLSFVNRSRLPITIIGVSIEQSGSTTTCIPIPRKVIEHTRRKGDQIISRHTEYSTAFPIQVQSLGGVNALVLFESLPQPVPADATSLTLLIHTNRSKPKRMTLELPEVWPVPYKPW